MRCRWDLRLPGGRFAAVLQMNEGDLMPDFDLMDSDGGGKVRFEEFAYYVFDHHPEVMKKLIPDFESDF